MVARTIPSHANIRLLAKKNLGDLLEVLGRWGTVYAPVEKQPDVYTFAETTDLGVIALGYLRTALPPKRFMYPPEERLYDFTLSKGFEEPSQSETRQILFGVHPCDIHAFSILDLVFAGPYPEPRYFKRRRRTAIIGLDCLPDEDCFCYAMDTDSVERGFDLFLTDLGEDYFVRVGSSWGEEVVRSCKDLFTGLKEGSIEEYKRRADARSRMFKSHVEMSDMPQIMELEFANPLWEDLGEKCLSCGSCSIVCPTCYCYDIIDQFDLKGDSGSRTRRWDSCLFKEFAQVAGFNFRQDRSTRVKLRYYHKQIAFVEEYGRSSCVGCGRCIETCPAKINIIEVLNEIRGKKVMSHAG